MANGDTKMNTIVRTWWGPLIGAIALIGSFYELRGNIDQQKTALENHCNSSQQALDAHIEASKAETSRLEGEIGRIDQYGSRQLNEVGSDVKSMQVQISTLQSTNMELKQSLKRIEDYLMKGPVIQ
jgi:HAMP domain-containing protein